jgi:hypothetical protein
VTAEMVMKPSGGEEQRSTIRYTRRGSGTQAK